uniref:Mitochondrial carrier protein n=1 Tax=Aplanochytrium stocchinoi TaxID=215587 RepID=A0A7S3LMH3_9STRA|mmetsp:Transcript_15255/g.18004  ORF Transcript_15255/g.18004 Transcript_15255/m.18004 type:complete len:429 (+) Transcript_15255:345-1631(+)|eukprot:CAMPEP_0204837872 /NCGR_PEP_ID=MMETSP1346-20131115/29297_1 /ASSEMBLY_ACC=CAM_ASM_000771 /TAXON_ID=215587 /ORGANISM="Aplanochytrium stocchinoi, Strain GSBS06" /LENGTH=428 /DNA_ID=CAMNT_0051973595 /DNA_START=398 /DNA_END=1684 /DNA_ORIENTATION=-
MHFSEIEVGKPPTQKPNTDDSKSKNKDSHTDFNDRDRKEKVFLASASNNKNSSNTVSKKGSHLRKNYSNFHDNVLNESDLDFEDVDDADEMNKEKAATATAAAAYEGRGTLELSMKFQQRILGDWLSLKDDTKTMIITFLCGGVAGATAKTVIAPFDRSKLIFQTTSRRFGLVPLAGLMKDIVTRSGVTALWRGHSLTLTRTFPYAGIQFMSHEKYKKLLLAPGEKHLPPGRRFIAGSLAGTTASVCVYPLEVLRSRMAVQDASKGGGIFYNARCLVRQNGLGGFYMGLKPALIGMVPYAGLAFGTFETLKVFTLQHYGTEKLDHVQRVAYGALSGLLAQTVTYPLDTVRRRMQTEGAHSLSVNMDVSKPVEKRYTGVVQTLRLVANEEGIRRGLFKGVTLNWFKGPVALGISFSTFEALKTHFLKSQ